MSSPEELKNRQKKASTGRHYVIVSYFFVFLFLGLIAYVAYFQAVESESYLSGDYSQYDQRQQKMAEQVIRGSILASDGTVLAETQVDEEGNETRIYPYNELFAHTVGYASYGASGLESSRGRDLLQSHADALEQLQNELNEEKKQGDNLVTSLNVSLQQAAYDALGDYQGAVVVQEVSTGRILVDVSKPGFNPNTLDADWDTLINDEEGSPLLNRALQGQYPPGSTFKIVTALAYYREHGTFDDFSFNCEGEYTSGGYTIHCTGTVHGQEDFADAFANSCNCAFAQMGIELGAEALQQAAESLYFNQELPDNIGLPAVNSSFSLGAYDGDPLTMQTAIGQGNTLASPLQMSMVAQAVANGGTILSPTIVDRVETYEGVVVDRTEQTTLTQAMTQQEADALKELMKGVVSYGTASSLADLPYNIAGKTGTAEYDSAGNAHAWFVGFSDTGNTDIVVTVIVEAGQSGSAVAVPIARAVFESYFS